MHEPRTVRPGRRAIVVVVLATAFGTEAIRWACERSHADSGTSGAANGEDHLAAEDLRDPVAALPANLTLPELGEADSARPGDLTATRSRRSSNGYTRTSGQVTSIERQDRGKPEICQRSKWRPKHPSEGIGRTLVASASRVAKAAEWILDGFCRPSPKCKAAPSSSNGPSHAVQNERGAFRGPSISRSQSAARRLPPQICPQSVFDPKKGCD